jgi:predicted RNA-binding protein YlxR (DUF448 family)
MVRFVIGPERALVPDLAGRLPGRGIWLSARGDVIETARVRGTLARVMARAAGGSVVIPQDLRARLEAGLEQRIVDLMGFARRAGQAVAGFEKVRDWLAERRVRGAGVGRGVLLQAEDGSAAERARLAGAAGGALCAGVSAAALGKVFGRERVVHVAVLPGRLAEAVRIEVERLAGLRDGEKDRERTGA